MRPPFDLLEAILWTPSEGFFLLERHLERLAGSAACFQIPVDLARLRRDLDALAASLPRKDHKVRITAGGRGPAVLSAQPMEEIPRPPVLRLCLAESPVDSSQVSLYHKTTRRSRLEQELRSRADFDDVILWNERGEITESCTANVVAEISGSMVTPPTACGLLAGTFRAQLLEDGTIAEQIISREALRGASRTWLVNSVRKWMPAELKDR
jgi:para-aminobenzoate synthetase / 4-amino-4-deoxychorismate lyase